MKSFDIQSVQGEELDKVAALYGVTRRYYEPDSQLRLYLLTMLQGMNNPKSYSMPVTGRVNISKTVQFDSRCYDSHGNAIPAVRANPHENHEVVENHALGKKFLYCRQCKVEVNE